MTDSQPPPPAPQSPPPPDGSTEAKPKRAWKTWHLAAVGIVAFLFGIAAGGTGGQELDSEPSGSADDEVAALEEQVEQLEQELADRDDLLAAAEEQLATTDDETEPEPEPEPEPETEPEPEPADQDGTYTAGDYSFADVQVSEDFAGDFEVRTRATNNGSDKSAVVVSATLFSGGSVVGTASGSVSDWASGQTVTLELISLDAHVDWDDIEFQIDAQF